jgi:excisionase family DNA binding protein
MAASSKKRELETPQLVDDGLVNVTEASEFLSIGRSKLYALMNAGRLPYVKIDRSRRIPRRALVDLAAGHLVSPAGK